MDQRNWSLKIRLMVPVLAVVAAGLILLAGAVTISSGLALRSSADQAGSFLADGTSLEVQGSIRESWAVIKAFQPIIMDAVETGGMSREKVVAMFADALKANPDIFGLYVVFEPDAFDGKDAEYRGRPYHDDSGRFIPYVHQSDSGITVEPNVDYSGDRVSDYYAVPKRTLKECAIEPYLYTVSGKQVYLASFVIPLIRDGSFIGIIAVDIPVSRFAGILSKRTFYKTGKAFLLSQGGNFLFHDTGALIGKSASAVLPASDWAKTQTAIKAGTDARLSFFSPVIKKTTLAYLSAFPADSSGTYWVAAVAVPQGEVMASVYLTIALGIGTLIAVAAATFLVLFLILRGITRPLLAMASEMGGLSGALESASLQVSTSGQELASGSSELASSIEEMTSSVEELQSIIEANTKNVNQASLMAAQAAEGSRDGGKLAAVMQAAMKEIDSNQSQIGRIIKVIDDIAFQTNILALNAAVEAARAGEAGRGFAVVAEQVKSLAQKSATAAKESAALIETAAGSVSRGGKSADAVKETTDVSAGTLDKAAVLMDEVSRASKEQLQGANQITKGISQINSVVQQTASSSEENAAAGEELMSQAETLRATVERLSALILGASRAATADAAPPAARSAGPERYATPKALAPQRAVPPPKPPAVKPEDAIPLKDFSDF